MIWKQDGTKHFCIHCGTGVDVGPSATSQRSADDIVVEFIQNFTKLSLDGAAHRELVRIIEAERTRK